MVIIFSNEKARDFLLKRGIVYTWRRKRRKQTGKDWMTDRRCGKKITDVNVTELHEYQLNQIESFVLLSGFDTMEEWAQVIAEFHKWSSPPAYEKGWVYKVTLLWFDEETCPSCGGSPDGFHWNKLNKTVYLHCENREAHSHTGLSIYWPSKTLDPSLYKSKPKGEN